MGRIKCWVAKNGITQVFIKGFDKARDFYNLLKKKDGQN